MRFDGRDAIDGPSGESGDGSGLQTIAATSWTGARGIFGPDAATVSTLSHKPDGLISSILEVPNHAYSGALVE